MKKIRKRFWIFSFTVGVLVVGIGGAWFSGVRYNKSTSYPIGFYKLESIANSEPKYGDLVLACLQRGEVAEIARERDYLSFGFCESGTLPLLKKLVAVGGDHIDFSKEGLSVNGDPVIPNTKQMLFDPLGRVMPVAVSGNVTTNGAFLVSDFNASSFDSRYFGEVPFKNIIGVVRPIKIWSK